MIPIQKVKNKPKKHLERITVNSKINLSWHNWTHIIKAISIK